MPIHLARRTQLAIIAAAAAVAGLGFLAIRPAGTASAYSTQAAPTTPPGSFRPSKEAWAGLKLAVVENMTFRPLVEAEGNIAIDDDRMTPVFSPYSGRVVKILAKTGERVDRGQSLMAVEASEIVQAQNDLISAVASLDTARSQFELAKTAEQRQHQLYLAKGGALKDWQQSQADLTEARSNLHSAEIALAAVRNRLRILGKSEAEIAALEHMPTERINPVAEVRAPISGTVTQRQVGLGEYINSAAAGAADPVYTIGDLSVVWLVANVREADAPKIRLGEPAEVRVLAYPGRVFHAKISWVASGIDADTHRLPVRADVENPDGALKPLMFARFDIAAGRAVERPAVPEEAVVYEGSAARLWVVGAPGTLVSRQVRTGLVQHGMVEITAGLAAGEKVVTGGALFIDQAAGGE
ncbi:MAG TPA: efflux RND transporter periplasmic adaptor subunit [Stellaceae bacterium]|nr:efflux RND transporter periplasmic adaptor subunit [Stellaceae bacterium]